MIENEDGHTDVDVTANKSVSDISRVELATILEMISSRPKTRETPSEFLSSYSAIAENYMNFKIPMHIVTERQFAILLTKNANLPSDQMNAIMYPVAITASLTEKGQRSKARYILILAREEANAIMDSEINTTRFD